MTARHDKATAQKCQRCRDQRHTNPGDESYACECGERTCACYGLQVRAGVRRDKATCLYPLDDGRRCLECETCQGYEPPDKTTDEITEAAAVDQAIADVRSFVESYVPPEGHHRLCASRSGGRCDCHGRKWEPTLAALRVLADAVEELRSERGSAQQARDSCHIAYVGERKLREAAEAERDRLARQVADLEEDRAISARMYRKLRDAVDTQKEATEEVDKLWEEHKCRMAARVAARSSDPK